MHPFPLESLMPECAAIPGSQKREFCFRLAEAVLEVVSAFGCFLAWGCRLWEGTARSEGGHLCGTPSPLLAGVHTAGRGPQLPAGAESCIYRYRRNFSMFFISLLNSCFHTHRCSEKCRGRNSSTSLTVFLQVKCSCLAVRFSHCPGAACRRGAAPLWLSASVWSALGPWGALQYSLLSVLKGKVKKKQTKKIS